MTTDPLPHELRTFPVEAAKIDNAFRYHVPQSPEIGARFAAVREALKAAALTIAPLLPPTREAALVHTKLEEAMFWANAAVARNQSLCFQPPADTVGVPKC